MRYDIYYTRTGTCFRDSNAKVTDVFVEETM